MQQEGGRGSPRSRTLIGSTGSFTGSGVVCAQVAGSETRYSVVQLLH